MIKHSQESSTLLGYLWLQSSCSLSLAQVGHPVSFSPDYGHGNSGYHCVRCFIEKSYYLMYYSIGSPIIIFFVLRSVSARYRSAYLDRCWHKCSLKVHGQVIMRYCSIVHIATVYQIGSLTLCSNFYTLADCILRLLVCESHACLHGIFSWLAQFQIGLVSSKFWLRLLGAKEAMLSYKQHGISNLQTSTLCQ